MSVAPAEQTKANELKSTEKHEKAKQAPGSWLARKLKTIWYLFYGISLLSIKLKIVREILSRNLRYDPSKETRTPDEVVVITGGPRGIAGALAKKFLQLNFTVIMGCRDVKSSQARIDKIREQGVVNGKIHLLPLDLRSLMSTKEFANGVLKHTNRIDFLINNAGIMMTPYECSEDGLECQFQVNYLSHFMLTLLLLPTIKRTSLKCERSCRIVNTTSVYHLAGSLDFKDLATRKVYAAPKGYMDSKLCQVMFTKQLEKRLQQDEANVHVYAVHPGGIPTELWDNAGSLHSGLSRILKPCMPTVDYGADTLINAALSSKLETEGGNYLEGFRLSPPNSQANKEIFQQRLWQLSEYLVQTLV